MVMVPHFEEAKSVLAQYQPELATGLEPMAVANGALVDSAVPSSARTPSSSPASVSTPITWRFAETEPVLLNEFVKVTLGQLDVEKFADINRKYELEMDFASVPRLCERFGLTFPQL